MLVFTKTDPIAIMNHIQAHYQDWNVEVVLGVNNARERKGHLLVFESELVVQAMSVLPPIADSSGKVDWSRVAAYVGAAPTTAPKFVVRPNRVAAALADASLDKEHILSALASNFRSDLRPLVIVEIVKFLHNQKTKKFSLPNGLAPQRGKQKIMYDTATETDFSKLKALIASTNTDHFEATYWRSVISKHAAKAKLGRKH